ncbi:MAG: hypothetical protein ABR568_21340 [Pyrinomonadaceae bacterium]
MPEDNERVFVCRVELPNHFAAATAGWEDGAVFVDSDNERNFGLVGFKHLGDGGMLGTEAEAGGEVETDAGVGFAGTEMITDATVAALQSSLGLIGRAS